MGIRDILGRRRDRGPYRAKSREKESTRRLEIEGVREGVAEHANARAASPETIKSPRRAGPGAAEVQTQVSVPARPEPPTRPKPERLDRADTEFYTGDTAELPVAATCPVVGVLIGVSGELQGALLPVVDGENRIGRDESCDIRLPGRYIPRNFASLVHRDGAFALRRLSERNPPAVNGDPVADGDRALVDGDRLTFGDSELSFRTTFAGSAGEERAAATVEPAASIAPAESIGPGESPAPAGSVPPAESAADDDPRDRTDLIDVRDA